MEMFRGMLRISFLSRPCPSVFFLEFQKIRLTSPIPALPPLEGKMGVIRFCALAMSKLHKS